MMFSLNISKVNMQLVLLMACALTVIAIDEQSKQPNWPKFDYDSLSKIINPQLEDSDEFPISSVPVKVSLSKANFYDSIKNAENTKKYQAAYELTKPMTAERRQQLQGLEEQLWKRKYAKDVNAKIPNYGKLKQTIQNLSSDKYQCFCNLPECTKDGNKCVTRRGCFSELKTVLQSLDVLSEAIKTEVRNVDNNTYVASGCWEHLSMTVNLDCEDIVGTGDNTELPELYLSATAQREKRKLYTYRCCSKDMCNKPTFPTILSKKKAITKN